MTTSTPIPLSKAKLAVERARRECEKATEAPWLLEEARVSFSSEESNDNWAEDAAFICLMRAMIGPVLDALESELAFREKHHGPWYDFGTGHPDYPILAAITTHFERVDGEGK